MKNLSSVLIALLFVIISLLIWDRVNRSKEYDRQILELEKLKQDTENFRKLDSVKQVVFNSLMDSVRKVQQGLQQEITERKKRDNQLIKNAYELKNKFDNLVLPERPNF